VGDFGLSTHLNNYGEYAVALPVKWTAPEAIEHGKFSVHSDVWSMGVLLVELFTYGGVPYGDLANDDISDKLRTGWRLDCPLGVPASLYGIMLECWHANPTERPTFKVCCAADQTSLHWRRPRHF
jgi:serine/threonine protein kinase